MATAIGLGAAASQYLTGLIVDSGGYNAGFLFLSIVAIAAVSNVYFYCTRNGTSNQSGPKLGIEE